MYKRLSIFLDSVTIEVQNKGGDLIAKERNIKMKEFICRLRDYNGAIIDGEAYVCDNKTQAELKYMQRLLRLGISEDMRKTDYITVE